MIRRIARLAPLLALPPLLGGCVVAAVPLVAGGLIARQQIDRPAPQTPAAPPSERVAVFGNASVFTTGLASSSVSAQPVTVDTTAMALPPAAIPATSTPGMTVSDSPAPAGSAPATATPALAAPVAASSVSASNQSALAITSSSPPAVSAAANPISAIASASTIAADPGSWATFARYAINRAPPPPPGQSRRSAVIDQATVVGEPKPESCGRQPPAVVIDLDPGTEPLDLDDPPSPAPGLSEALDSLRNIGVTVLWLSARPASDEDRIRRMLRAVELDEGGGDKLLLLRNPSERKQTRRIAALRDWCIVAVAGDRRSDFDELFDYLLDTTGPTAVALEPLFGDGWFIAPPPVG